MDIDGRKFKGTLGPETVLQSRHACRVDVLERAKVDRLVDVEATAAAVDNALPSTFMRPGAGTCRYETPLRVEVSLGGVAKRVVGIPFVLIHSVRQEAVFHPYTITKMVLSPLVLRGIPPRIGISPYFATLRAPASERRHQFQGFVIGRVEIGTPDDI